MTFSAAGELRCRDCGALIDLARYRRKIPRCDDCEIADAVVRLDAAVGTYLGACSQRKDP